MAVFWFESQVESKSAADLLRKYSFEVLLRYQTWTSISLNTDLQIIQSTVFDFQLLIPAFIYLFIYLWTTFLANEKIILWTEL